MDPKFQFTAITIFPEMFKSLEYGIAGQALKKNLYKLTLINPRHYAQNPRGYIDDRPYGGGPGMVITAPPIDASILAAKKQLGSDTAVVNLSPHGYPIQQKNIDDLLALKKLIFICGRYEGIDQRVLDTHVTHSFCLADMVLSGGEYAVLACLDAIIRCIPGAISNVDSLVEESFRGELLDYPVYTKPKKFKKKLVPTVLLSGDHARIHAWRQQEAKKLTNKFRAGQNIIQDNER